MELGCLNHSTNGTIVTNGKLYREALEIGSRESSMLCPLAHASDCDNCWQYISMKRGVIFCGVYRIGRLP
jgi:hypothetical protein